MLKHALIEKYRKKWRTARYAVHNALKARKYSICRMEFGKKFAYGEILADHEKLAISQDNQKNSLT